MKGKLRRRTTIRAPAETNEVPDEVEQLFRTAELYGRNQSRVVELYSRTDGGSHHLKAPQQHAPKLARASLVESRPEGQR